MHLAYMRPVRNTLTGHPYTPPAPVRRSGRMLHIGPEKRRELTKLGYIVSRYVDHKV